MAELAVLDAGVVSIAGRNPLRLRIGLDVHDVVEQPAEPGAFAILLDGRRYSGWRHCAGTVVHVRLAGRTFTVTLPEPTASAEAGHSAGGDLRAPLPGTVVAINTEPGAAVRRGDTLLTIESMKVQMALPAPRDGVVAAVHVALNTVFERDALLISLHPET